MSFTPPDSFSTRPTLEGSFGMAASTHWLASGTAMSVLERGGNAFDAAVAAGFVLMVVEPNLNGPGGELVAIMRTAAADTPLVLAGTGPAPAGASIAAMRDRGLTAMPGAGPLSAPVPGQVDAWLMLLCDHGTWELEDVLDYAIHYARHGYPVTSGIAATVTTVAQLFAEHWPTSYDAWTPGGRVPRVGDTLTNTTLGDTFERLMTIASREDTRERRIALARQEWSEGFVARAIVRASAQAHWNSEGGVQPGLLTEADLGSYRATYEPTVSSDFRDATVHKVGPWSQGPALLQILGMLADEPVEALDPCTASGAHVIIEAIKLAMADRDRFLGTEDAPLDALLSPHYLAARRRLIGAEASISFRPGSLEFGSTYIPPLVEQTDSGPAGPAGSAGSAGSAGEPTVRRDGVTRGDTCHVDVVDRWGNTISVTPSGGWLQSSPHIADLGFCLSSRLQQTWLDEDSPAALAPGKRPRITLTPTLVCAHDGSITALGTPGGDGQDQWQLLYLLRTIVGGYTIQQAIDAPAFQCTSFPDSFWPRRWTPGGLLVEDRLGVAAINGLMAMGHRVTRSGPWSLGRLSAVRRDPATGRMTAGANPRGAQGYAAGR